MKKLAFVIDSLCYGGSETQTVELVNELARRRYEIVLFSLDPVDTLRNRIDSSVGVWILKKRTYLDFGSLRKMIAVLREFGPDAMLFVNTYSMMYGFLTSFFLNRKARKIVIQHSTLLETRLDRAKNFVYRRIMNRMDRVVFVSRRQMDYWVSKYRIRPSKSVVIYNGIDIERFERYSADREALLTFLGFLPSDILIGIVARLTPEKRHEDLLEAVDLLRRDGYPVRLLIIGDGERRGFLEKRIREKGLEASVKITGFVEDVRNWLACTDISVLSSSTEALSMALIESMAMSKPIVLTDVGGARELVVPLENGIVYEPGNIRQLYQALKYVIDNNLFASMGRKSLSRAKEKFQRAEMVRNYMDLIGCR